MTTPSLPIHKGQAMNDKTKLGLYLLFPPFLLWLFVLMLWIDQTLAEYLLQQISPQTTGVIMVIAGLVFPGTSLFTGITCMVSKEDKRINLLIAILSALLIALLVVFIQSN